MFGAMAVVGHLLLKGQTSGVCSDYFNRRLQNSVFLAAYARRLVLLLVGGLVAFAVMIIVSPYPPRPGIWVLWTHGQMRMPWLSTLTFPDCIWSWRAFGVGLGTASKLFFARSSY